MGKFLSCAIFFVIVSGLTIHFNIEVPYFSTWAGHLPGDLILTKGNSIIYLPLTTAALISAALTFLGTLFAKK